jgi:hypothetical protein
MLMKYLGVTSMMVLIHAVAVEARAASSSSQSAPLAAPTAGPASESQTQTAATGRGAYEHDGFYLRFGLGFGGFTDGMISDEENANGEQASGQVTGVASVGEIMIGGSVRRNLILGGGVWTSTLLASSYAHTDGDQIPSELRQPDNFTMIGPFFDYYFGNSLGVKGAFHLQGSPALAVLNGFRPEQGRHDDDRRVAVGAGLMAGFGYEWWVEKQWGLGVLARLSVAGLAEESQSDGFYYHGVATFPALLFTGTYN